MVVKKNLISEFKKLNSELEKHLGKIGTDMLVEKQLDFSISNSSTSLENKEELTLIASSLVDIRTEMALLRKHFSNDIENIVLNSVQEQQNIFMKSMSSFQANLALEMKKNFGFELKEIVSELREIKRSHLKTQAEFQNKNVELETIKENQELLIKLVENSSLIQDFEFDKLVEDIKDLKLSVGSLSNKNNQNKSGAIELSLSSKINNIETQLEFTNSTLKKLFQNLSGFEESFGKKLVSNIDSKISLIENDLDKTSTNYSNLLDEIHGFEKNLSKKFDDSLSNYSPKSDGIKEQILKTSVPNHKKTVSPRNSKLLSIEKNLANLEKSIGKSSASLIGERVYDIDTKLKQLNLIE